MYSVPDSWQPGALPYTFTVALPMPISDEVCVSVCISVCICMHYMYLYVSLWLCQFHMVKLLMFFSAGAYYEFSKHPIRFGTFLIALLHQCMPF